MAKDGIKKWLLVVLIGWSLTLTWLALNVREQISHANDIRPFGQAEIRTIERSTALWKVRAEYSPVSYHLLTWIAYIQTGKGPERTTSLGDLAPGFCVAIALIMANITARMRSSN